MKKIIKPGGQIILKDLGVRDFAMGKIKSSNNFKLD